MKHTDGPWEFHSLEGGEGQVYWGTARICHVFDDANGELLADAPALLDLLREARAGLAFDWADGNAALIDRIDAMLAKHGAGTGRS